MPAANKFVLIPACGDIDSCAHALCQSRPLPYPIGRPDVFAMAVSVVAQAA